MRPEPDEPDEALPDDEPDEDPDDVALGDGDDELRGRSRAVPLRGVPSVCV